MTGKSYNDYMQRHVGSILTALLVSFTIGTIAMVYNSDKNNEVFKAQLNFIAQRVTSIEVDIKDMQKTINTNIGDKWTKTDHLKYSKSIDIKFENIRARLRKVENKVLSK